LLLQRGFPGGRAYFISRRIGRTYPGPPLEVVGLLRTNYNPQAPVARVSAPGAISDVVVPGTDAVMCLSCHVAHASPYPDMLRWNYTQMIAGGGGADGQGCFVCHTQKDGT